MILVLEQAIRKYIGAGEEIEILERQIIDAKNRLEHAIQASEESRASIEKYAESGERFYTLEDHSSVLKVTNLPEDYNRLAVFKIEFHETEGISG